MVERDRLRRRLAASAAAVIVLAGCGGSDSADSEAERGPGAEGGAELADLDRVRITAVGDIGMEAAGRATLRAMGRSGADVHVVLGDLSYAGPDSADDFCRLVRSEVGESAPFEIVAGNHEDDTGEDGPIAEFARCLPDRAGAVGDYGTQYYFDVDRLVRFILISPDLTIDGEHYYYGPADGGGDTAALEWLDGAIEGAREDGIRWTIVGMHKNCISVGEYYCDVYQDLFTRLIERRVDLVISGHDHSYQRSKQIAAPRPGCREVLVDKFDADCLVDADDSHRRGEGPVFLISGAGGGRLYRLDPDDPEAGYFAATMGGNADPRHGFALLDISAERLAVEFVGSTSGRFADEFEIRD